MTAKRVVAIKFEAQHVKLVTVRHERGVAILERAEHADALAPLLAGHKVSARCLAALPREEAFSRVLTLPTTEEAELRAMVELQAKSFLPYGQTEVILDYLILSRTATHTTVLLLGVARPVVERHLTTLSAAGIVEPELTLTTSGLLQWYRAVRSQLKLGGPVVVLELEAATAECLIVTDSELRVTRSIPLGTPPTWFEELDRTLESYRTEHAGEELPAHIVVTGDPVQVSAIQGPLQEWMRMTVLTVDQWKAVAPVPELALPQRGGWSSTLGLAMTPDGTPLINLLPPDARRKRLQAATQRHSLVTAGLALGVLCALALLFSVDLHRQRVLQMQLNTALHTIAPRTKVLSRQLQRMTQMQQALRDRGQLLTMLQEFYRVTPMDVGLTQWLADADGLVHVRGMAPSLGSVLAYVKALEDSPHLANVRLRYSTERTTQSGMQVEFEIVCQHEGASATSAAAAPRSRRRAAHRDSASTVEE